MKKRQILLLLPLLMLGGCIIKPYLPVPDAAYSVESRYAIIQTDSLTIFVRPQTYSGDAQAVGNDFFNLYIRVKNTSARTVALNNQGFSVIANHKQFDYIPLQVVLGSIPTQFYLNQNQDPFGPMLPETQSQSLVQAREQYLDLVNSYFSFGDILPGGIKEGYLFFDDRIERYNSFILDAMGTRVVFQK